MTRQTHGLRIGPDAADAYSRLQQVGGALALEPYPGRTRPPGAAPAFEDEIRRDRGLADKHGICEELERLGLAGVLRMPVACKVCDPATGKPVTREFRIKTLVARNYTGLAPAAAPSNGRSGVSAAQASRF